MQLNRMRSQRFNPQTKIENLLIGATLIYWTFAFIKPYDTHDLQYWSNLLSTDSNLIKWGIFGIKAISIYVLMRSFHSSKGFVIFILPPFSVWEITEGLLKEAFGFAFLVLYAANDYYAKRKTDRIASYFFLIFSMVHIFSGISTLIVSLYFRRIKHFLFCLFSIIGLFLFTYAYYMVNGTYFPYLSWIKLGLILQFSNLLPIDQFSIIMRSVISGLCCLGVLVSRYEFEREREGTKR